MRLFDFNSPITFTALLAVPAFCMPVQSLSSDENIVQITSEDILKFIRPIKIDQAIDITKKITSLSYLENNWDGYGAVSPSKNVLNNAIRFINSLPETVLPEINTESIVPTPYGSIVIDFEKNADLISVELGERKIGFFSEFSEGEDISMEGVLFNQQNLPIELETAFTKLYKKDII
jgi:hypothetical protein